MHHFNFVVVNIIGIRVGSKILSWRRQAEIIVGAL
jgi:hypothetical protein